MPVGPAELLVIEFPGSRFTGGIVPELTRLVESGTITIIDGVFVRKDRDGNVRFVQLGQIDPDDDASVLNDVMDRSAGLVSDTDVEQLAGPLAPGSSAAILVFEHTWAKPLRDVVMASGGVLAADLRIPAAEVDELLAADPPVG
jgi:uncharacterized membrane protein